MINFKEYEEIIDNQKSLEIIRKGIDLQRGSDFWEDFLSLCGNADGMSQLLGVPKEKVTSWFGKINKLKSEIGPNKVDKTKDRIIKTGDKV